MNKTLKILKASAFALTLIAGLGAVGTASAAPDNAYGWAYPDHFKR